MRISWSQIKFFRNKPKDIRIPYELYNETKERDYILDTDGGDFSIFNIQFCIAFTQYVIDQRKITAMASKHLKSMSQGQYMKYK